MPDLLLKDVLFILVFAIVNSTKLLSVTLQDLALFNYYVLLVIYVFSIGSNLIHCWDRLYFELYKYAFSSYTVVSLAIPSWRRQIMKKQLRWSVVSLAGHRCLTT